MSELTKKEIRIAERYDPSQSPEENAQRISKETGIKLWTCRCYITSLQKGLTYYDYVNGEEDRFFSPTESLEIIKARDRRNCSDNRTSLSRLEQEEIQTGVQKILGCLSQEQKDLVITHFYEGESYREIADSIGIKRQAVGSRMKTIFRTLRSFAIKNGLKDYASE